MNAYGILNAIRKSTDMGVVGISAVLPHAKQDALREVLLRQRQEYSELYNRADCMLQAKGGKKQDVPSLAKTGAKLSSEMKLMGGPSDSKIAEMMIEGNTKGMIKSYQNIRALDSVDSDAMALSRKLLDTELHNIEQMKKFL